MDNPFEELKRERNKVPNLEGFWAINFKGVTGVVYVELKHINSYLISFAGAVVYVEQHTLRDFLSKYGEFMF